MVTVTLAGCTDPTESGPLAMEINAADDPVTEATTFSASGSFDRFVWNFGDGSGDHEGKTIEHVFGFTDGTVTVRLTGFKGDEPEVTTQQLSLGSGRNTLPVPVLVTDTEWVKPGEPVRFTAERTTDENGDPILYRWSCTLVASPPPPPHGDNHGAAVGVPFGVNVLGQVVSDFTEEVDRTIEGDMCTSLGDGLGVDFTMEGTIEGSFETEGLYNIDVEIKDPKSNPLVGRMNIFVTNEIPEPTAQQSFEGSFLFGNNGAVDEQADQIQEGDYDIIRHSFRLELPTDAGSKITFTQATGLPVSDPITYSVEGGGKPIITANSLAELELSKGQLVQGFDYDLIIRQPLGAAGSYTWTIDVVHIMSPYYLYAES